MQKGEKIAGSRVGTLIAFTVITILTGCSKQVDQIGKQEMVRQDQPVRNTTPQLSLSASRVVLLEGNAKNVAARFNWSKFPYADNMTEGYTLEACVAGNGFANPVGIMSQYEGETLAVTVEDMNDRLRNILITGTEARVEFRVKLTTTSGSTMYSAPVALEVTTYQPSVAFENKQIIRVPGNYQSWKIAQAPMLVSSKKDDKEYEGFVYFNNNYAQFLLVKSVTTWEDGYTFTDIGAGKFGFNGNMFALWEGAGIYKCNASTNTNKWSCTRIYDFSINGSASGNKDIDMEFNTGTQTWTFTGDFSKGEFRFRANHSDKIVLGHNNSDATGTLAYNAQSISIPEPGKYKIVLSLLTAGNYSYGVQRVYP